MMINLSTNNGLIAKAVRILSFVFVHIGLFAVLSHAEVNRRKPLVVGGETNYPPYEFINNEGNPTGFNVEIMQAVAEVMGFELDIQLKPWSQIREEIETGKIDVSIGMLYAPQRDRLVDFSTPYNIVSYSIFLRKGSPIYSMKNLQNKEILVQKDDFAHDYLVAQGYSDNLILVENMESALINLASGRYDCAVIPRLHGLYLTNKYNLSNIDTFDPQIESLENCLSVAEGNSLLLAQLNEGLSIIKATGKYEELYRKWFSVYEKNYFTRNLLKYILWLVTPLTLLLIGFGSWSWSLKRQVFLKTKELRAELTERNRAEKELKKSHELLRELTMHLQLAREEERAQIARDIHDELGQIFTALQLDLYYLKQKNPQKRGLLNNKMNNMLKLIDTSCDMIQEIATRLRPRLLDHLGLVAAMEWHLEEYERRSGICITFEKNFDNISLEKNISISIFRIFQEILTNVARHAEAKNVSIEFCKNDGNLLLKVKDDGKGITSEEVSNPKSFGLIGMRERLSPWNGTIRISGVPNKGTTIAVNIDLININ